MRMNVAGGKEKKNVKRFSPINSNLLRKIFFPREWIMTMMVEMFFSFCLRFMNETNESKHFLGCLISWEFFRLKF